MSGAKRLIIRMGSGKLIRALQILCGTLLVSQIAFGRGPEDDKRLRFTVSAAPWTLTLPAGDFVEAQRKLKPDGTAGYFYLTNERLHLIVSFFIEPVSKCKDSKSCRDLVLKAGNPSWENPTNLVSSQIGEVSCFEFLMPSFRGQPVQQQHMYAEFVVDGFWVDLHISKVLYQPEQRKLFEDLVKAIKFEKKTEKDRS